MALPSLGECGAVPCGDTACGDPGSSLPLAALQVPLPIAWPVPFLAAAGMGRATYTNIQGGMKG